LSNDNLKTDEPPNANTGIHQVELVCNFILDSDPLKVCLNDVHSYIDEVMPLNIM